MTEECLAPKRPMTRYEDPWIVLSWESRNG